MESLVAACPVCDAEIPIADGTEQSEILYCWDCSSRLVTMIGQNNITLNQAQGIEEEF